MDLRKNLKIIVLLVGLSAQGFLISSVGQTEMCSQLIGRNCDNAVLQIAGGREVPDAGSIVLLAFGSLWLRNKNRKNRKQFKY